MTLTLSPELEQQITNLVLRGEYPNTEALLVDAFRGFVRETGTSAPKAASPRGRRSGDFSEFVRISRLLGQNEQS